MATGGASFDERVDENDLAGWTVNGTLEDRLNNRDWGVQQQKANRSSEKNKKKVGEAAESRLTNGISPESTPGTGRRRARTPHSYGTQMSVPEQAELERLRQRINFTDLDQRSIGSDSQGRVTAANNQRQLAENKKAFNFLPLRVNTNNSKQPPPVAASPSKEVPSRPERGSPAVADGNGDTGIDSSQIVSKLVQIREYIGKASTMRDDLVEKSDVPANVERLSHLIDHLKQQEKSYLRFLQKMLAREDEEDDLRALDSPAGSSLAAEGTSLNVQFPSEGSRSASRDTRSAAAKEDLENLHKQQDLLKKMLEQQEQLRALQGRQVALLAMQHKAPQASAADDTIITETTGSVSGLSITSELNDELNDLIQRFHNQLHDTQTKTVPDNRRQAESLSLSWEASRGRTPSTVTTAAASSKRATLKELQDKKETMDKILQELHALRDQTLNNSSCKQLWSLMFPSLPCSASPGAKLRKLKEVHTRLNELRELVQYYEQTSDMMVDTVNENIRDEEEESEDGSIFETIFDSEQENREPATNLRNPKCSSNWMDMNSLASARCSNNREGRLNTECEINNRSAANLRSLNTPKVIECQYNRDRSYNDVKDNEDEEEEGMEDEDDVREQRGDSEGSVSSRRSSLGEDPEFVQKVHRLQTAKEKLRQLQELVAMVQSDDTDATTGNEEDNPKQRPNNARIPASKSPKDASAQELYEARLREQQQELKRLQDERLRLMEIQGKIQDLQWACPELQSSVSSMSEQGLNKAPAATSTPSVNVGVTRPKPVTAASAPDNELWSEMRRHQIQREELRNRRKQLESLMAEHQRRSGLADVGVSQHASLLLNRDERTMATWGDSTQSHQNEEDDNPSEMEAREGEDEGGDYSSGEDVATYPDRKGQPYSARASRGRPDSRTKMRSKRSHDSGGMKRQENLRWASDLSFTEGRRHWQEQVAQLKKQLDFSTSMCQTLMQDQQTLSYMLQTLLSSPYSLLPSSVGSPQLHFVMHQLHQCYTQLAWQQSNVQRLRQVLDQLIRQQQSQSSGLWSLESCVPGSVWPMFFWVVFLSVIGMAFDPIFTPAVGEFTRTPQTPTEHNTSAKTEYMGFPQAFDRSPHSGADSWWVCVRTPAFVIFSPSQKRLASRVVGTPPAREAATCRSLESLSSMPDPTDPTTVTKTFRTGGKASAQASLASRDKTPSSKGKRRRNKGHVKAQGVGSDGASSGTESVQVRAKSTKLKEPDQGLLDRLTRAKLDGKASVHKTNDLSSGMSDSSGLEDASSDFSLFEALRETIYSEVATLISQNESRPHFLIELFHELQLLNTDYLRQRALFSLQDIVSRHLTESKVNGEQPLPMGHGAWATASNSELTPSESLATSDTVSVPCTASGTVYLFNTPWDCCVIFSILFACSGNTVIHMDKTTAHTKLYEHSKLQAESNSSGADATAAAHHAAAQLLEGASDNTNVHCPQIDTQQLDRQIKGIMTEVIPVLKEHMDEVCSPQLLSSIRRMVLELTQHDDDSKEFVRFFHRQLGGILRFAGRTLKECGEDLLVEISEILFNELAFFRLMQDLDHICRETSAGKLRSPSHLPHIQVFYSSSTQVTSTPTLVFTGLSKAETQPLTNYGSGEDEGEEEELEEFDAGPVDVQTSLQASQDTPCVEEQVNEVEGGRARRWVSLGSGKFSNLSQKSDEEDFVKVEDLPLQLSVMCKEELQKRIAEEQLNNNLSTEILNGNVGEVLVGNSQTLKEPETVGAQSA
uniref:Pericentriolar material 1 n=1 Tax=Scleropages formosus TaxID=113540 RepID=A0A8C9TW26_SCLFO